MLADGQGPNHFPGWTRFLEGCVPRLAALGAASTLAASSKQTSEQCRCPDVLYKHGGETITREIQSWGVPAVSCRGWAAQAPLLLLFSHRGGLRGWAWGPTWVWVLRGGRWCFGDMGGMARLGEMCLADVELPIGFKSILVKAPMCPSLLAGGGWTRDVLNPIQPGLMSLCPCCHPRFRGKKKLQNQRSRGEERPLGYPVGGRADITWWIPVSTWDRSTPCLSFPSCTQGRVPSF